MRTPDGIRMEVEGYLVQANAISGCSGSPVFVARTLEVQLMDQESNVLKGYVDGSIWLLGVWQSSWKVAGAEIIGIKNDGAGTEAPLGMGIVVPANSLLELLSQPELRQERVNGL